MLDEGVFRTIDVAREDRFDAWWQAMNRTICPMDMSREDTRDFLGEMRLLRLGDVCVWPATLEPVRWRRTPRLIRRSDPEFYHLSLPLRGTIGVTQGGRQASHGPSDMYVVDTSMPWDCRTGPLQAIGVEVPKRLVPLPSTGIGRLVTRRLPGREGPGALLLGFLIGLTSNSGSFRVADGPWLESVVVDLLAATLAHQLDAADDLPPETRTRNLVRQIRDFIQRHLHDPDLTPSAVAAAHHISLSYLHRLFRTEDTTVAAWIRRQRLERAHRELRDPALRSMPVHEIAARWGFKSHADFTRSYRTAYGVAPRDHRPPVNGASNSPALGDNDTHGRP
ncbi:helix-turn-helix domain-containing protein [Streptomyces sp. NPDC053750]|uniref:AraC-like ligand-binding domain-containing protein n=1 Tax=Streptomyces sp. NPDC053750 TaxID=3365714 RepID=UPI0037CDA1DA